MTIIRFSSVLEEIKQFYLSAIFLFWTYQYRILSYFSQWTSEITWDKGT